MAQSTSNPNPIKRTLIALAAVFALLHFAGANDLLSNLTRPVVVALIKLLGFAARDAGSGLVIGRLHVPWTRDCAGVNLLAMLWAVTLWANRAELLSSRYWLRVALAAPAALLANIARIFTLLAYRHLFFPAVETPQLHYFIGFLWLIPCLPVFVPRSGREPGRYFLETLFLAAALSLASPYVPAPGGNLVLLSVLLLLAQARFIHLPVEGKLPAAAWIFAAGFIAITSMESLWIPWMALCPWFGGMGLIRSLPKLLLVLGTIPLVSMHPIGACLVAGAVIWEFWSLYKSTPVDGEAISNISGARSHWFAQAALALLLIFPFIASSATGLLRPSQTPPPGAMSRMLAVNTYEVHLIGQPADIHLVWYGPSGDGRHHTLPVCMRYRGIRLKAVKEEPTVMTDGKVWMREFFIHRNELLTDYRSYLARTLWPWSPAGVHLIASSSAENIKAKDFTQQSEVFAREIHALGQPLSKKKSGAQ